MSLYEELFLQHLNGYTRLGFYNVEFMNHEQRVYWTKTKEL